MTLPELLKKTVELDGSDLHLTTNTPPQVRVHGHLQRLEGADLTPAETKQLAYSVLTDAQKKRFEEHLELDFSFGLKGLARFRCNMFNQRGSVAAVYRLIPEKIRSFQELNLPAVLATLAERPRGLVLVTGPTGSGKSTTLAAMIDKINKERHDHILTIEDPIEFVHQHQSCLVNQREVHSDTETFSNALRAAHRGDGPPHIRHAPHELGGPDDQPDHRYFSGVPAEPDPDAALARAGRDRLSGAAAEDRRRPGGLARDHDSNPRDSKPDPRGQDPSDLFRHADRPGEARNADDEPVAGDTAAAASGDARDRDRRVLEP